jgi:hypothetical protein
MRGVEEGVFKRGGKRRCMRRVEEGVYERGGGRGV